MLRLSTKNLRPAAAITLAATMFVGTIAAALPARADDSPLNRRAVIARAKTWTKHKVPYSQSDWKNGYRTDCSGFVAMAWNIPENIVTWNVPLVAKPISKSQLEPGDVLLNTQRDRHVVMFEKWVDKKHTSYWVLEQTGQNSVEGTIRRKMTYPYRIDGSLYKPYRFVGMSRYLKAIPKNGRQPVAGYKKDPAVLKVKPVKAEPKRVVRKPVAPKHAQQPTKVEPTRTQRPERHESATNSAPQAAMLTSLLGWLTGR